MMLSQPKGTNLNFLCQELIHNSYSRINSLFLIAHMLNQSRFHRHSMHSIFNLYFFYQVSCLMKCLIKYIINYKGDEHNLAEALTRYTNPLNSLKKLKSTCVRPFKYLSADGIEPESLFPVKFNFTRLLSWPKLSGSAPVSRFFPRYKPCSLSELPSSP